MKKLIVLFLVGIILVAFSTASALDLKGKFAVSGNGGLAIPIGDLADSEKGAAKMGFNFYGTAEYFVTPNIGVGGFLGYYSFGTDNDAMKEVMNRDLGIMPDELDITQKGLTFGAFGKYLFDVHEKAAPYVKVGAGMGKPKFSGTAAISAFGFDGDIEGREGDGGRNAVHGRQDHLRHAGHHTLSSGGRFLRPQVSLNKTL
jgi:hypothetical protein